MARGPRDWHRQMNKGRSTYLDLVRITAAGIVFGHHLLVHSDCYQHPEVGACGIGTTLIPYHMGHLAVVLFFVDRLFPCAHTCCRSSDPDDDCALGASYRTAESQVAEAPT